VYKRKIKQIKLAIRLQVSARRRQRKEKKRKANGVCPFFLTHVTLPNTFKWHTSPVVNLGSIEPIGPSFSALAPTTQPPFYFYFQRGPPACLSFCQFAIMTLSQPGSAEKTIRKIDIAQVRKNPKSCHLGAIMTQMPVAACECLQISP
jgi:hypothetical protein